MWPNSTAAWLRDQLVVQLFGNFETTSELAVNPAAPSSGEGLEQDGLSVEQVTRSSTLLHDGHVSGCCCVPRKGGTKESSGSGSSLPKPALPLSFSSLPVHHGAPVVLADAVGVRAHVATVLALGTEVAFATHDADVLDARHLALPGGRADIVARRLRANVFDVALAIAYAEHLRLAWEANVAAALSHAVVFEDDGVRLRTASPTIGLLLGPRPRAGARR